MSAQAIKEYKDVSVHTLYSQKPDTEHSQARIAYVVDHFNENYGTNYKDLSAWKQLCADLGIDPIPESIKQCKKVGVPE